MLNRTFICCVILLFLVKRNYSQQTVDNEKAHRRYWYYRTRMINDFMKIGKNQGDCIVLAERNKDKDFNSYQRKSQIGPDQIDLANMYIMALALEYKLLSRNNQDTRETVNELYHMLYMINRLDAEADQFWSSSMPTGPIINQYISALNGFMIREDMAPAYLSDNLEHFNYGILESTNQSITNDDAFSLNYGGFCGTDFTDEVTGTKFNSFVIQDVDPTDNNPDNDDMYGLRDEMGMPHDKFHTMLIALMFVNKYLPYGVNNGQQFQDGEWDLKSEAKKISDRIYNYIKGPSASWVLTYPDFDISNNHILNVGAQAQIYSWPLSRMACYNHKDFPWSINDFCSGYNDPTSLGIGLQVYKITSKVPQQSMDASVFMAWDQAGSNSPAYSLPPIPAYIAMQGNTAAWSLEWAELVRKVLHQNGALLRQLTIYGDPINVAPCQGPYNYGSCHHGGYEWSAQDRTEHPNARGASCGNSDGAFQGNYPGVDYMLLHNLYYEYQNQVKEGNQGNVGPNPIGGAVTAIFNAVNGVPGFVNSSFCDAVNLLGGVLSSSGICDPANSGNGGIGSVNANMAGYYAYNYMDNRDENVWPRKAFENGPLHNGPSFLPGSPMYNAVQGIEDAPAKVAVFQNLSSVAHIYHTNSPAAPGNQTPSNVTYRAGKEIVLEPGFTVDHGSTFRAFVQRYLCNGNSDPLTMRKRTDSTLVLEMESVDYENDQMNPIPIHYFESPKSDADNHPIVSEDSYNEDYIADIMPLDSPKSSEFKVTPNPTNGKIKVETKKTTDDEMFSIHVYDMKGVLIYFFENVSHDFEINLEGFSKGIYMIQVTSNLGNSITKKIDVIE